MAVSARLSRPRPPSRPGAHVRAGVLAFAGVAACGPVVGATWAWLTPPGRGVVVPGGVEVSEQASQSAIAADGYFAVLGLVVGVVCGGLVFVATRGRGVAAALALATGGLAGSLLACATGSWLGPDELRVGARGADVGTRLDLPLDIGAQGVLLVWPTTAVAVLLVLTATLERVDPPGAWRAPYGGGPSYEPRWPYAGG